MRNSKRSTKSNSKKSTSNTTSLAIDSITINNNNSSSNNNNNNNNNDYQDDNIQSGLSFHDESNNEVELSREVSSISLMKGELSIDDDFQYEEEEADINDDEIERQVESIKTSNFENNQENEFDLHLPDFEQLMNQYSKQPPASNNSGESTNHNNNDNTDRSKIHIQKTPVTNISIGTAPSVKSQFYHSTTSHLDSEHDDGDEGLSMAGESEYVSYV